MKVAIILPRGMHFSPQGATSIDIVAHDLLLSSRFQASTHVLGAKVSNPYQNVAYEGLEAGSQSEMTRSIIQRLSAAPPDVAVVHQHPETAHAIAKDMPDCPVLLHRHGLLKEKRGHLSRFWKRRQFSKLAGIVFVSTFLEQRFLEQFPECSDKSNVIFNGIDTTIWAPDVEKHQTIVFLGRAREDKGILPLISAFKALQPDDWSLKLILGVQTDAEQHLFNEVSSHCRDIDSISILANEQSAAVRAHLGKASIAVLPSIVREGFPRAVVEALACGCAVVATRQGGTPEAAGDAAILLDNPHTSDFQARLQKVLADLLSDPERRQQLGLRARRHAITHLGLGAVAEAYDDLLEKTAHGF